jgi:peroxiredoxin
MREDIKVGAIFPDYELPDHTDVKRKLSFLQGNDPMILMLGRGIYCPKDRQQLNQLVQFSSQCDVGFVRIVYINCDNLILLNDLRLGVGAHWPFLRDENRTIMKDLGIEEYTDQMNHPMIPHTIVLEPGLIIHKIYNGYWYWGRPSVAELHQDLRAISMKHRFDFKIDTPEMRQKWESGQREDFYPYGKTWAQVFARMAGDVEKFEKED